LFVDPQTSVVLLRRMTIERGNTSISFLYLGARAPADVFRTDRAIRRVGTPKSVLRRLDDRVPEFSGACRTILKRHDRETMSSLAVQLKL
jgi:hypothetical protein